MNSARIVVRLASIFAAIMCGKTIEIFAHQTDMQLVAAIAAISMGVIICAADEIIERSVS